MQRTQKFKRFAKSVVLQRSGLRSGQASVRPLLWPQGELEEAHWVRWRCPRKQRNELLGTVSTTECDGGLRAKPACPR
jgi:hypothetical protein